MLQEVVQPLEQLPIEGVSSPSMSAQILDFCDDGDLFPEISGGGGGGGVSAGAGSGGVGICCYDDSSFPSNLSPYSSMDASALSTLLDSELPSDPEPDIILSENYAPSQLLPPPTTVFPVPAYLSNLQDHLDQAGFSDMTTIDGFSSYLCDSLAPLSAASHPPQPPPPSLPTIFDDECISSLSRYMGLEPSPSSTSCSFMDPTQLGVAFYPGTFGVTAPEEGLGIYTGCMTAGPETGIQAPEVMVEYRGEGSGRGGGGVGIYGLDNTTHPRSYGGSGDLQALGDHQHLVNGCGSPTAPLASDMPPLEESSFKVGRLSVEERKERIHRYMKKRNERNFSKKIKYACRKTLADSRPRVRGRFAKNDEFGEPTRPASSNHEDEDEEEVATKEDEDIIQSPAIYAHLSGLNSFKYNYSALESWI